MSCTDFIATYPGVVIECYRAAAQVAQVTQAAELSPEEVMNRTVAIKTVMNLIAFGLVYFTWRAYKRWRGTWGRKGK